MKLFFVALLARALAQEAGEAPAAAAVPAANETEAMQQVVCPIRGP